MKKAAVVIVVMVLVVAFASLAGAAGMAGMQKGTIKSVDAKAHKVVFCAEGTTKDETLKVAKGVDISNVKAGDKVEVSVHKGVLKHVMVAPAAAAPAAPAAAPAAAPKASVGC